MPDRLPPLASTPCNSLKGCLLKRLLPILVTIVVAIVVTFGWKWYAYVTNTESPYDEVGIEVNSRLPGPLNKWGCDRLHETFPGAVPPYGCQAFDGSGGWR